MGSSDVDAAVAWPGEHKLHGRLGDEEAGTAIFECFTGTALHCRITRADFKSKDEVFLKSVRADVGGGGVEEYRVIHGLDPRSRQTPSEKWFRASMAALSLAPRLARQSADKGSKYGLFILGCLYCWGEGGVAQDHAAAVSQFQAASAQNFDEAQHWPRPLVSASVGRCT